MRHYTVLEKADENGVGTGLFHMTSDIRGVVAPTGYCADGCPGHDSREGAAEHYRQYKLDHLTRYGVKGGGNSMHKCRVCGEFTQGLAVCNETPYDLCEEHNNREGLSMVLPASASIWTS
jgi:hypothetical protein